MSQFAYTSYVFLGFSVTVITEETFNKVKEQFASALNLNEYPYDKEQKCFHSVGDEFPELREFLKDITGHGGYYNVDQVLEWIKSVVPSEEKLGKHSITLNEIRELYSGDFSKQLYFRGLELPFEGKVSVEDAKRVLLEGEIAIPSAMYYVRKSLSKYIEECEKKIDTVKSTIKLFT